MGLNWTKIADWLFLGIVVLSGTAYISVFLFLLADLRIKNSRYPLPRPVSGAITAIVSPLSPQIAINFQIWFKPISPRL